MAKTFIIWGETKTFGGTPMVVIKTFTEDAPTETYRLAQQPAVKGEEPAVTEYLMAASARALSEAGYTVMTKPQWKARPKPAPRAATAKPKARGKK